MDKEIILNDWNPSEETWKRWAYDENILFDEQDEDLVLHREEYLPLLIELAGDAKCPKAEYILACLDSFLMSLVLRGSDEKLSVVSKCATLAALSNNEAVLAWGKRQQRRLDFRKGIGAVDQDQAMAIADELLKGICRQADLILIGDTADAWEIKFSVPPMHLYEERLIINKHTGTFTYSRSR